MNDRVKKAQLTILTLFGIMILFSIGNIVYFKFFVGTDTMLRKQTMRLVLTFGIMYLVYIGKHWAKILLSVFIVAGIVLAGVAVYISPSVEIIVYMLIICLLYAYTLYYMNANDDFEAFLRYQRENHDKD